jgi:hypothetical protein
MIHINRKEKLLVLSEQIFSAERYFGSLHNLGNRRKKRMGAAHADIHILCDAGGRFYDLKHTSYS